MNKTRPHFSAPSDAKPLSADQFRQRLNSIEARGGERRQLPDETAVAGFVASAMARGAAAGPLAVERGDPVDRLPPGPAQKLRALRSANEDVGVLLQSLSERQTEERLRKQRAEMRLRELVDDESAVRAGTVPIHRERIRSGRPDGHIPPDDQHPALLEAKRAIDSATRELSALDERTAVLRGTRWAGMRRLETYLRSLPGSIAEHDGAVEVPKRLTLEAARERIAEIRADIHQVQSAAQPSKIVKARLRAQVADLAAGGAPDVGPCVEIGVPLQWPMLQVQGGISAVTAADNPAAAGFASFQIPNALGLFCWLHRDALIKALEREVDAIADDENALTDEQRASKISALRAQLLDAERVEEALVCASEQQGVPVLRRTDADPRATLGLSSTLPAPR